MSDPILLFWELKRDDDLYVAPTNLQTGELQFTTDPKKSAWFGLKHEAKQLRATLENPERWKVRISQE